jgi:undecaprenyl diphosphate synthase
LRGARIAKQTIEACAEMGIDQLTLYAFSTENWKRPRTEVSFLMLLLGRHLRKERLNLVRNNIRFSVIGEVSRLPAAVLEEVEKTIAATSACTGMSLTFALSYGARQEITQAAKALAADVAAGRLAVDDITEETFASKLQTAHMPDPDLIVRTSGEFRLSNFMLWQSAYSELYVTQTLWPDFERPELQKALDHYATRERRFGCTTAQIVGETPSPKRDVTP